MSNIHDLYQQVGELRGEMKRGFESISKKLDEINSCLDKHDTRIDKIEDYNSQIKGAEKEVTKIASIGGAIAGGFVTAVVWIAVKLFGEK